MNRLKKIRRAYGGISLRVLSVILDKQGTKVGWTHLNHYEIGKTSLSERNLNALAKFFNLSKEYINGMPPQTANEKSIEEVIKFQDKIEKKVDIIYDG